MHETRFNPGLVLEEISVLFHGSLHLGASQLLQVSMANFSAGLFSRLLLANRLTRPSLSDGFADAPLALMIIWVIRGKR
jgi:hypothetical protein